MSASRVHEITRLQPHVANEVRDRFRLTAPVTDMPPGVKEFIGLSQDCYRANFIVHAVVDRDASACSLETMKFCVTFLRTDGLELQDCARIWVSGDVMNTLIATRRKKIKFVFDETVFPKEGWRQRNVMSQDDTQA